MKFPFDFHKTIVLRSPLYDYKNAVSDEELLDFFNSPLAKEALYIASPDITDELDRLINNEITDQAKRKRLLLSLRKYHNRMHTRCTPFGLFSAVSAVSWGDNFEENQIEVESNLNRFTRFDMHYLCAVAKYVENLPNARQSLKFKVNSSLYVYGDKFRYIEYSYDELGRRSHQISEVDFSDFLQDIFDSIGDKSTLRDIANFIADEEVTYEEAAQFVEELAVEQLIVSELEYTLTGENYVFRFLDVLKYILQNTAADDVKIVLDTMVSALESLNHLDAESSNDLKVYDQLIEDLSKLPITIDKKKLFQIDSSKKVKSGQVDKKIKNELKQALFALSKMSSNFEHQDLDKFKAEFNKRYDGKEQPLMKVLDSENGIGYGSQNIKDDSGLTNDVFLDNSAEFKPQHTWDIAEQWKISKLNEALAKGEREVVFTESDLELFKDKTDSILQLPPSISILFSTIKDGKIKIDSVGNPSALNYLGRFAHCDPKIETSLLDITAQEQALNPNVIFAEIVHLPEDRIGNILQRPVLRPYEIPYLAQSNVDADHQITLDDLMVSVNWGRVYLRSKRLNKEIAPRLGTAHNFSSSSQPVYHFLADLQFQDVTPFTQFYWNKIEFMYPFLPRATYNNCVLSPARWIFKKEDLDFLNKKTLDGKIRVFQEFKFDNSLPKLFSLADGDNELLINSENEEALDMFFQIIAKRDQFTLVEFFEPDDKVVSKDGKVFSNQFITSLVKNQRTYYHSIPEFLTKTPLFSAQEVFSLGDQWLYLKLYTGIKTADKVLDNAVTPLINILWEEQLIESWFFIRYNDPDDHLRIRFLVPDQTNHALVVEKLRQAIKPFESSGEIWKVQSDSYHREVNRYGKERIHLSEQVFMHDSDDVLKLIDIMTTHEYPANYRWIFGMLSVDAFLDGFGYTLEKKLIVLSQMSAEFSKEFNVNKRVKKTLSDKYRQNIGDIELLFDSNYKHPFKVLILSKIKKCQPIIDQMTLSLPLNEQDSIITNTFIMGHIHMIFNRIIPANQRKHEMVIYDLFVKYYKKQLAMRKIKQKATSQSIITA